MNQSHGAEHSYALETGKSGAHRLELQNDYLFEESCHHLTIAGLKEGLTVYDIGCGTGCMTNYIASKVGPTGRVYAIDSSEEQLEIARQRMEESDLKNVIFIRADILNELKSPLPSADLIYARFVLMHVRSPLLALHNMFELLKPRGTLALQEPVNDSCYVQEKPDHLQNFIKSITHLGSLLGVDYNIGWRLKDLVETCGVKNITQWQHQPKLAPELARLVLTLTLQEWGRRLLEKELVTVHEYEDWAQEIKTLDHTFCISNQFFITGIKP
jgi:ubiquinone/menaquinone biosynthesis C-methylase UbiE